MSRLCERPGCSSPASIAYGIDHDRLLVWLDVLEPAVDQRAGVLCRRHADAMVVPLGWMLDDHREPAPRLFKVSTVGQSAPAGRRRRTDLGRRRPVEQLELDGVSEQIAELLADDTAQLDRTLLDARLQAETAEPTHESPPAPPAPRDEPETSPDIAWSPVFDEGDDLGGLLSARSPLLSRAFGTSPTKRSRKKRS